MDYRFSDDCQLLQDSLRRYLQASMPQPSEIVGQEQTWKSLAAAGWPWAYATALRDGTPGRLVEALHVMEVFGEVPVPAPIAVVAGFVMPLLDGLEGLDVEEELQSGWLLTAALPRLGGTGLAARWSYPDQEPTIRQGPAGRVVEGVVDRIPGAEQADAVIIPAWLSERLVLAIVRLDAPGVTVTTAPSLDLRHGAARVDFANSPVAHVADCEDLEARVHAAAVAFSLFLDAEAVGGAAEVTRRTIAYVSDREQFGRPVGSFQAVRHRLADMAVKTETARALTHRAAWDLQTDGRDAFADLLASRLHASAAYVSVCEAAIQCHGGMGFTWEQGLHVWYRAALADRALLTDVPALRRVLTGHLAHLAGI